MTGSGGSTSRRCRKSAVLAAVGGVVFLGTLGQFLLSRQGLIMQMIEVWGNGGC